MVLLEMHKRLFVAPAPSLGVAQRRASKLALENGAVWASCRPPPWH